MAWRIVIEGEGEVPPAVKPWIRSVMQSAGVTAAELFIGEDLGVLEAHVDDPDAIEVRDLLATIEEGD